METKKINDIVVKAVKIKKPGHNVKGKEYFSDLYFNCLLCARTNSGKTNCLYNILKNTVDERTSVYIFCSTIDLDPMYERMKNMLIRKKCNVFSYNSFLDGGVSIINGLLESFKDDEQEEEEVEVIDPDPLKQYFKVKEEKDKPKKRVKKYKDEVPKRVIIFDDLSSDIKHPDIQNLLTKSRHYHTRVFLSCHDLTNLSPTSLRMLTNILIFKGLSDDRIKELSEKCEIAFDEDKKGHPYLLDLYKDATKDKYSFLYANKNVRDFRKNFNQKYIV
jgi:hypothetical protein